MEIEEAGEDNVDWGGLCLEEGCGRGDLERMMC